MANKDDNKDRYYTGDGSSRYYTDGGSNYYTGGGSNYYTGGGSNYYTGGGSGYYTGGGSNYYNGGSQPLPVQPKKEDGSIDVKEWLFRFIGYWPLFVVSVVVVMCLGFLKNRSWAPQYTTESKIVIDDSKGASADYSFMQNFNIGMSYANVNNQLLILGSYNIINRTLQKVPFSIDYFQKGRFRTTSLYGREPIRIMENEISNEAYGFIFKFTPVNSNQFTIEISDVLNSDYGKIANDFHPITAKYGEKIECMLFTIVVQKLYMLPEQTEFYFQFRSERSLEEEFAGRLELGYMGSTKDPSTVVSLTLTSEVSQRDQDFLNALGKEFLAANLEEKNEEAVRTIEFINEQLYLLSDSLNTSEARLRQYRAVNNLVDMSSYSTQMVQKLNALDQQRSELSLKDAYFDALSKYLTQTVMDEKLVAPSSIGVADPTLLELVSQFNELQQKRSDIGEKNPQYPRLTKRMNEIRETMLEVLKNVRKVHNMERSEFQREYSGVVGEIKNLPSKEFEMVNYERAYKINDNYYTFLLQKQSEAQIRKASNVPDNKILQDARTTLLPVNTRDKMIVYLISLLVGLLLPAAYIVLRVVFDNNINNVDDIMKATGIPFIGAVLHTDSKARVASTTSKRSVFTEKYRIIRSRIETAVGKKDCSMISVTSAESGDGKSFFSLNIAGVYSMVSKKVLLMDMDLRNPTLSRTTGFGNAKGLVHVLIGDEKLDDVIVRDDDEFGYDFIPVGVVPINSAELIKSDRMSEIFDELKSRYEYIIIDTSPLGLVADAMDIMRNSDANVIVTRARKSNKNFFRSFTDQVSKDGIKNCFVTLNDVPVMRKKKGVLGYLNYGGGYGYGYGYGSNYGYGYGYGYGNSYGYGYGNSYGAKYYAEGEKYYTSDEETDSPDGHSSKK